MPRRTTGRLEKRGKIYLAIWTHAGKRYAKSTGTADKAEAERFLREQVGDFAKEDVQEQARRIAARAVRDIPSPLLASAWSKFEAAPNRSKCGPGGEAYLKSQVVRFLDWIREHYPKAEYFRDVDDSIAEEYWADLQATYAPFSANKHKQTLARVWAMLCEKDPIALSRNPWRASHIKALPKVGHTRRELTVEELARVVAPLEGEWRTLFGIGVYTGLRLGDAACLDWSAVDLVRGFLQLKPAKTAKHGTVVRVPIAPALRAMLEEKPARKRRGPVLPEIAAEYRKNKKPVSVKVQSIFKAAGIETTVEEKRGNGKTRKAVEVGFHSLRHTFVSIVANAGVPLAIVQAIVGHTDAAMTEHYFHVADTALQEAAQALPNVLAPKSLPAPAESVVEAVEGVESAAFRESVAILSRLSPAEREKLRAML